MSHRSKSSENKTLSQFIWKFCLVYVDDIIVWSKTEQKHFERLIEIFKALNEVGFKLKLSKCEFFMKKANYLGYVIE